MRPACGLLLSLALVLAGCGGGADEPRVLPTLDASVPAVSPSAAVTVPSAAAGATPEAAAEFARYVYEQIERAFATRDPKLVEAVSMPTCESCRNFVASITEVRDSNGRVDGYRISVRAAIAPPTDGSTARVDVIRDSTGGTFLDSAGRVLERQPPLRGIEEQMDLIRVDGKWSVSAIKRIRVRG